MKDILDKAARIRLLIFDVDGVLTDGSLFVGDDGQEYKAFNSRDGHGIKMLKKHGVEVAIITGRTSQVVEHRMANLGIKHVYQGKLDKLPA
jgi:3-deoxy-D-manno-octulosonate 8-phosphate phosphatase (KDO 8-P phosphatase)